MKIVVIGCTHAGTAAIVNAARLYPDAQITVYERNNNISFLSCGIALYVEGVVADKQGLFYSSPEQLAKLNVITKMEHDVSEVFFDKKTLLVQNLQTGEEIKDNFDKLIITTGSWPILPALEGSELANILLCKNYNHANTIIEKAKEAKKITVIGGGYIGIELVEAFESQGKEVTLIDNEDRIMSKYLDPEFTRQVEDSLKEHGIICALGQSVTGFSGCGGKVAKVITSKGEYETDLVILCVGFRPNTQLFQGQLDMLANGAIIVDNYMQTSQPEVFAAGDNCAVMYNPTQKPDYIPLATNAVRMGTLVAQNLVNPTMAYLGTQGTSAIKIFAANIATTGLTETAARQRGFTVKSITITENHRPEFMPTYESLTLKVVFEIQSHRILGAQLFSGADFTQAINTLSVCIQNKMTIDELAFVDFFFQPHYNKPWNFLNTAGLKALDELQISKETIGCV